MSSFFNTVKGNGDLAVKNSRTLRCDENQITSNVSLDLTIYTVLICGHLHLLNVLPVWVLRFSEMTIPCVAVHIKESNTRPPARLKLERLSPEPLHTLLRWIFLDPILLKSINHAKLLLMINEDCPRFSGSDNGTEFKNRDMLEFCGNKGIKQEYTLKTYLMAMQETDHCGYFYN
ncbi:hypothetical protein Tco_1429182 [Tanacetum coccineum]